MAINSTINKVSINIADMDRHYYHSHELVMAQHPSETDLRFMMRLIAFILNANDQLSFTKGLSTDDEPSLWQKTLTGEIELWVDLGQVDEKRIKKACGRAKQVLIYTYNNAKASVWWKQQETNLQRYKNLTVYHIDAKGIEGLVQKNINLQCNIQDGELYLTGQDCEVTVTWNQLTKN